jgi:hypothetical protein
MLATRQQQLQGGFRVQTSRPGAAARPAAGGGDSREADLDAADASPMDGVDMTAYTYRRNAGITAEGGEGGISEAD